MSAAPATRADTMLPPLEGGVEQWQDWMTALDDGLGEHPLASSCCLSHESQLNDGGRQNRPREPA